jgi:hypothetical protein
MKNYDTSFQPANREQTVKITVQNWEYKWTIILNPIRWNCLWYDILTATDFESEDFVENLKENNIQLSIIEDSEWNLWTEYILKDDKWNTCGYSDDICEFQKYIVSLEIIECKVIWGMDTF